MLILLKKIHVEYFLTKWKLLKLIANDSSISSSKIHLNVSLSLYLIKLDDIYF